VGACEWPLDTRRRFVGKESKKAIQKQSCELACESRFSASALSTPRWPSPFSARGHFGRSSRNGVNCHSYGHCVPHLRGIASLCVLNHQRSSDLSCHVRPLGKRRSVRGCCWEQCNIGFSAPVMLM
jgi:hypothetical protein